MPGPVMPGPRQTAKGLSLNQYVLYPDRAVRAGEGSCHG